jgi:signal transduction histidine kinase/CheY-like chemotaxis protein
VAGHSTGLCVGDLVALATTDDELDQRPRYPHLTGTVGVAVRTRHPVAVSDVLTDPRIAYTPEVLAQVQRSPYRAVLALPLPHIEQVIGALSIRDRVGRIFDEGEVQLAQTFADQAATALRNAHLFQEAQRAYHELARTQKQLLQAQKMEALGQLAGGIAHDFNNILAGILGYTELALHAVPPAGAARRYLQWVISAVTRAKALVTQILTFSRQHEQVRQQVDLFPIIQETLDLLRAALPSTIGLRSDLRPDAVAVLADPTQMQQLLLNLCTNAAQARQTTGGVLEVGLDAVEVDAPMAAQLPHLQPGIHVRVTVRDTGHGIGPEFVERIFEPFFTTKAAGEGTGLGLVVVHGIVTDHAGAIAVESIVQEGTRFTIYLPRLTCDASGDIVREEAVPHGSGRILFVEDEATLAHLGQDLLGRLGYEVVVHTSSVEALATFQAAPQHFDLVITDQTMPQMTGAQLADELRRLRPNIPIILCTGFSHSIDIAQATA